MSRGKRKKTRGRPVRQCIVTGQRKPRDTLLRFVVEPNGTVTPDIRNKLPGRGLWVTADKACLARAISGNAFGYSAKRQVKIPKALDETIEPLLAGRVCELLSMARKSGCAVSGFQKVKQSLLHGGVALLVRAREGSTGQFGKLPAFSEDIVRISCMYASELGIVFGRDYVIYASVSAGRLAERIATEAERLSGVRFGKSTSVSRHDEQQAE